MIFQSILLKLPKKYPTFKLDDSWTYGVKCKRRFLKFPVLFMFQIIVAEEKFADKRTWNMNFCSLANIFIVDLLYSMYSWDINVLFNVQSDSKIINYLWDKKGMLNFMCLFSGILLGGSAKHLMRFRVKYSHEVQFRCL